MINTLQFITPELPTVCFAGLDALPSKELRMMTLRRWRRAVLHLYWLRMTG